MNQFVWSDGDHDNNDEEEGARVALVMRDVPSLPAQDIAAFPNTSQKDASPALGVVWAEAHVEAPTSSDDNDDSPPAEVVAVSQVAVIPVEIDNETLPTTIDIHPNLTDPSHHHSDRIQGLYVDEAGDAMLVVDDRRDEITTMPKPAPITCSLYRWNFIVCIFGNALLSAAASVTFTFEFSAIVVYLTGAVFYHAAEGFSKVGDWTLLFQTLFRLLSVVLLSLDLILLTISTLLVELLSWIAGIFCILFGGITVGVGMHQHIRQVCEWIRSLFRKIHTRWNPPRMEPYVFQDDSENEMGDESMRPF